MKHIIIIVYIVGLIVYLALPFPVQIGVLLFNTMVPDPIPYIDEIIMYGSAMQKCAKVVSILEWIAKHKVLTIILAIIIVVCVMMFLM